MKTLNRLVSSLFSRPTPAPATVEARELARRLSGPQRHRLLQGYPMRRLMEPVREDHDPEAWPIASDRRLIVGVLPHAFCNPQVQGCGFCTFPQEPYRGDAARETVDRVAREVRDRTARLGLTGRTVDALYFGGATANLTPPDRFEALTTALLESFDLRDAEVTLEGVPAHFLTRREALLQQLAQLPVRQPRISMGVQTFHPIQLRAMGRTAFGTPRQIAAVVERARTLGLTTSGDFLINLPGQTRQAIEVDLERAVELGFDQVCVYHLVLFRGLGTPWSKDEEMLRRLPDNTQAYAQWRAARDLLLRAGYVQTTLTNFERADVHKTNRRFRYESHSFRPDRYDALGFGPSAITCLADDATRRALKLINLPSAAAYGEALDATGRAYGTRFEYRPRDTRLLHLTRGLSGLKIPRDAYRRLFGTDPRSDFSAAFDALEAEKLVWVDRDAIKPTERGMFFADSVAGLLAWRRSHALEREAARRELPVLDEAGPEFMG